MSDLAYFEYATVISCEGNQFEGIPARYLVEVATNNPVTGKKRDEEELKKLANNSLTLALGLDVQEITEFTAISESEVRGLKKIRSAGKHQEGSVFLVEQAEG